MIASFAVGVDQKKQSNGHCERSEAIRCLDFIVSSVCFVIPLKKQSGFLAKTPTQTFWTTLRSLDKLKGIRFFLHSISEQEQNDKLICLNTH